MDGPGTYSQPPYAGGSKDESGTAAKDTISIGSGDRVSGEDRMGMEVHADAYRFPRWLYMFAANSGWPKAGKNNGLRKKDLLHRCQTEKRNQGK
jgi:hypothetical protein